MEVWRDIKGFEGVYKISNLGNVKSLYRVIIRSDKKPYPVKEKIIATNKYFNVNGRGYLGVCLIYNRRRKTKHIHRLLAESFIPNPKNKPQVNHIDGNKLNNSLNNLEWVTASENIIHGYKLGLLKVDGLKRTHLTRENILEIRCISQSKSMKQKEIAVKFNVSVSTVSAIKNGSRHGNL